MRAVVKTTLEIVIALTTSILLSGALVGLAILGVCALSAGGGYWLWRRIERKRPPEREADQ